ncbi:DDE-type integrase/transposase/recombinase [Maribacter thermophilus]|uniref:DDE-type integrase/transposase/recombinase n=1 Tax=Maribacter thermophilus TaxID=1197874 RepID=UPI0018DBAAB8|nr:DDE-type integrase/transposase/recombinase [Maribacter thermophilus]
MAIIDLHSRFVVHWSVSNSMDAQWCAKTLEEAVVQHGKPEIINTDQGSQFTSDEFSSTVLGKEIKLSMDGKGRATDIAFIERLWGSVKYEEIYLNPPNDGLDLFLPLAEYFEYYNNERRHGPIDYERPMDMFKKAA